MTQGKENNKKRNKNDSMQERGPNAPLLSCRLRAARPFVCYFEYLYYFPCLLFCMFFIFFLLFSLWLIFLMFFFSIYFPFILFPAFFSFVMFFSFLLIFLLLWIFPLFYLFLILRIKFFTNFILHSRLFSSFFFLLFSSYQIFWARYL